MGFGARLRAEIEEVMLRKLFRQRSAERAEPAAVLSVVYTKGEDGYIIAECPQLPGCMSQGRTTEEARRNIVDAMRSVLAVRMGTFVSEACSHNERPRHYYGHGSREESFRLKEPELIAV
jgi:predicted RNase H-like HicB family nuclease